MNSIKRNGIWMVVMALLFGAFFAGATPAAVLAQGDDEPEDEPEIEVHKFVSVDGIAWADADTLGDAFSIEVGADLQWKIEVTNTGTVSVSLTLSDTLDSGTLEEQFLDLSGVCSIPEPLESGIGFECIVNPTPPMTASAGLHSNLVTVEATHGLSTTTESDWAYYVGQGPDESPEPPGETGVAIEVEKSVSADGDDWHTAGTPEEALLLTPGADLKWKVEVANTGTVEVDLALADWLDSVPFDVSGYCNNLLNNVLKPGQARTCTFPAPPAPAIAGLHGNVVTVTATYLDATLTVDDWAYYQGVVDDEEEEETAVKVEKSVLVEGEPLQAADSPSSALVITPGAEISWTIEVSNTAPVSVDLAFEDTLDGTALALSESCTDPVLPTTLEAGQPYTCVITSTAPMTPGLLVGNLVTVTATYSDVTETVADWAYVRVHAEGEELGTEGCGVGYWKNHTNIWFDNYGPDASYGEVFGVDSDLTLLEALEAGGGHEIALGRQAVAALLNAANPDVDYAIPAAEVIAMVKAAYASGNYGQAKDMLEEWNERICPLGGPADPKKEQPGTRTRRHWKQHSEQWPLNQIEVGRKQYSKQEALALMSAVDDVSTAADGDMTYYMFSAAVATKLNVAIGNDPTCVDSTLVTADDWLADHPVGSGVSAADPAWQENVALYNQLESYNGGGLCAPFATDLDGDGEMAPLFLPLLTKE